MQKLAKTANMKYFQAFIFILELIFYSIRIFQSYLQIMHKVNFI